MFAFYIPETLRVKCAMNCDIVYPIPVRCLYIVVAACVSGVKMFHAAKFSCNIYTYIYASKKKK